METKELVKKLRSYNKTSGYARYMEAAADKIEELLEQLELLEDEKDTAVLIYKNKLNQQKPYC